MKTALTLALLSFVPLIAHSLIARSNTQGQVWQADVQIRTLEVTRSKSAITARVVVYSEKDDEARDTRLIVLLPLGVGIDRLGPGTAPTPLITSMVQSYMWWSGRSSPPGGISTIWSDSVSWLASRV